MLQSIRLLVALGLVPLFGLVGCTSENSEYCENDASCMDPAAPVCHPSKHYCHAGCASDQDCQDPASSSYEPGKPVCQKATRRCVGAGDDGGRKDAGPDLPVGDGPKLANGTSCQSGTLCQSGFCVDGVCCAGACDGVCVTCNGPASPGTCVPVPAGEDPRKSCAGKHVKCAGTCDGSGSCTFAKTLGLECEAPSCAAGVQKTSSCDATGSCAEKSQGCGGYACSGTGCRTSCVTTSTDCVGTAQCVGGKCVDSLPLGSGCGSNDQACKSGFCTDGFCCKIDSCGACQTCGATGDCTPIADGTSCGAQTCTGSASGGAQKTILGCKGGTCTPTAVSCGEYLCNTAGTDCLAACSSDAQCKSSAYCDGSAKCVPKKPVGQACGGAKECQNGLCVDGYCCATACTGLCMRCDLAVKGQCAAIPSGQNPDSECPGTVSVCAGSCNGAGACAYPVGKVCQGASCSGSTLTSYGCDATGGCAGSPAACANDYMCASASACATSCTAHTQCVSGYCDLYDLFVGKKNTCAKLADTRYANVTVCPAAGAGTKTSPHCKIQSALDALKPYVLIADGTYQENLTVKADAQLVALGSGAPLVNHKNGVVNPVLKATIAPLGANTSGILIGTAGTKTLLRGLRVTFNGAGGGVTGDLVRISAGPATVRIESCELWEAHGSDYAALRVTNTGGAIQTVTVTDSVMSSSPYGVLVESASAGTSLSMSKVVIVWNGIYGVRLSSAAAVLTDAFVVLNSGKGIYASTTDLTLDRAKVGINGSSGIDLVASKSYISNTLVNSNTGPGIAIDWWGESVNLHNVTLVNNSGDELKCVKNPSAPTMTLKVGAYNSILWDDTAASAVANTACVMEIYHGDVKGGWSGTGTNNLNQAPLFSGATGIEYQLTAASPCVDTGSDSYASGTLDIDSNTRLHDYVAGGSKVDRGAYELH